MESIAFSKNGTLKLPPGFRFHPTDEELVVQYLKKKVFDHPLPATVIPEADVCKSDPWDLPGEAEQMKYFFSTREAKYPSGCRSNRATVSGFWKSTGIDKQIVSSKTNGVVGMKKTLVFYQGKPPHGSRTNWVMHEYRLAGFASLPLDTIAKVGSLCATWRDADVDSLQGSDAALGKWVICRIFLKKRGGRNDEGEGRAPRNTAPVFYDFLTKQRRISFNDLPACSSSELSEITELSYNNQLQDNDESSCCDSLNQFR